MLRKIRDFYINSSIHVALAVVALTMVTALHFDIAPGLFLYCFIFFGTITGYNFVKYAKIAGLQHRSLTRSLKQIQMFSFFSFLILVALSLKIAIEVLLWCCFFGLLTLLYALPVFGRGKNLRSLAGIKIYVIALVWSGASVVLPLVQSKTLSTDPVVVVELLQRFVLVLVWILPFEIRDLKYDLPHLNTLPQKLGIKKTKNLGFFMLLFVVLLDLFIQDEHFISTAMMVLISGIFLWYSSQEQSAYYTSFWIEAIPILWLLIMVLLRGLHP